MEELQEDIEKAVKNDRVSGDPLVAKGLRTVGPNRADIVISNDAAAKLHSMSQNLSFLEKCRVIVVVD